MPLQLPYSHARGYTGDKMSYKPFDVDAVIESVAPLVQLPIADEYRPGVRQNLKTAAKMAALLAQVKLDDSVEPAPVYRP